MLGDVTAALAVVFAFAMTFPSEWMDRLQHYWSVCLLRVCKGFYIGVFALQQPI